MISDEGTKKTTIELPKSLLDEMAMRAIAENISLKTLFGRVCRTGLMATARWGVNDKAFDKTLAEEKKKVLFSFKTSDDPEDRFELEYSVEDTKSLFISVSEALINAGVDLEEMLRNMGRLK